MGSHDPFRMADTNAQQLLFIQQALTEGRTGDALQELQVLLARQPEHGKAQALYGSILFRHLKDFSGAEEAFRIAMRQAPAFPDLYIEYGELLLQLDKGTETVAILNRALEVPGIAKDKIYRIFGQLYERQQKWEDAIDYYNRAILFTLTGADMTLYQEDLARVKQKISLQ